MAAAKDGAAPTATRLEEGFPSSGSLVCVGARCGRPAASLCSAAVMSVARGGGTWMVWKPPSFFISAKFGSTIASACSPGRALEERAVMERGGCAAVCKGWDLAVFGVFFGAKRRVGLLILL